MWRWESTGQTCAEAWADEGGRPAVLDDVPTRVTVLKGEPGRHGPDAVMDRLLFDWKPDETWLAAS